MPPRLVTLSARPSPGPNVLDIDLAGLTLDTAAAPSRRPHSFAFDRRDY